MLKKGMRLLNKPQISIITVSYNAAKTIEQTILSVVEQTYSNIEYIIIDGGSTDGTVDIIKKYADRIAYWVSEPDKGIYDAMNKGIDVATGDWVYFIGADDRLYDRDAINKFVYQLSIDVSFDIYCGRVVETNLRLGLKRESKIEPTNDEIRAGNMIPHQGMFVKASLLKEIKFSTRYKIASDFEFLLKCVKKGVEIKYFQDKICFYTIGGASYEDKVLEKEYRDILFANNEDFQTYAQKKVNNQYKIYIEKFFPTIIVKLLKKWCGWEKINNG